MANWSDLKASVAEVIKTNGNQEITGQNLNSVLNNIINNLGANANFAGVASPETNPGTPDGRVFYIASKMGTYNNFNGFTVNLGEIAVFIYRNSWEKYSVNYTISEVNVSNIFPTEGIDGSNRYTLDTAIEKIPESLRTAGIKCSFFNETSELETWEYKSGAWNVINFLQIGSVILKELKGDVFLDELHSFSDELMVLEDLSPIYEIAGYFLLDGSIIKSDTLGKIKVYKSDGIIKLSYFSIGNVGSLAVSDVSDGSRRLNVLKKATSTNVEYYIKTNQYVYVYVGERSDYSFHLVKLRNKIIASKDDINRISNQINKKADKKLGENLFNKNSNDNIYDSLLSRTNTVSSPSYGKGFMVTHYINIEPNKPYIANYTSTDNSINLCVLDASYSVLIYINKSTESAEYRFTAPENAAFVRMTIPMSRKDNFVFNEGESVKEGAVFEYDFLVKGDVLFNPWKNKTIGLYGDSITALCGNNSVNSDTWAAYLRDYLSAKIIVRGWGGTTLRHSSWDNSVAGANKWWFNENGEKIAVGTGGGIEIDVAGMCDWKRIITQFPSVIKDEIDAIILMGGTNDFFSAKEGDILFVEGDNTDVDWHDSEYYSGGDYKISTIKGAVCSAIMKLQVWMPQAVIIIATPLSGRNTKGGINGTDQLINSEGLNETQFASAIKEAAMYMSVPIIDINTLTGINQMNRKYYIADSVHPYKITDDSGVQHNDGNVAMARVFMKGMDGIYPKFNYVVWK